MTTGAPHLDCRRLRAPREDRAAFVAPPLEAVGELVEANRSLREQCGFHLAGRPLREVSHEARQELLAEARAWTSQYRDIDTGVTPVPLPDTGETPVARASRPCVETPERFDPSAPIFLGGHQPQLFHPGVWLKNFVVGELARLHGAVGVNLLIDSDVLKTPELRVPGGSVDRPQVARIAMDAPGPVVPYEERRILDRQTFEAFGRRVADRIAPLIADPLVRDYWPLAVQRMQQDDRLGASLAQSRHQLEGRWGLNTLEVPQSRVCGTRAHAWFVIHMLAELPRLRAVYNEAVEEYRRVHRIRNRAHPVPNLAREGEWLEAPFWIWTSDDPRRRRLFVRPARGQIVLSDRQGLKIPLPFSPEGEASRTVDRLGELGAMGVKIRCRALLTTLWARLVLGDLFVHGIGGAKYDQVTDAIIRRFFRAEPPRFLVVSATIHLPVARRRAMVEDLRAIDRGLRELTYHPECSINGVGGPADRRVPEADALVDAKRRWIRTPSTPANARTRFEEIRRINEALQPYVQPLRARLEAERRRTARAVEAEAILSARDYAFCLFPEKTLREFLAALLPKSGRIVSDSV